MTKLDKIIKRLKSNERKALGYESMLDFYYGYITALYQNDLISAKEKNMLIKVYASTENDWCRYSIENGKLVDNGENSE